MNLSELKECLQVEKELLFRLPDGHTVPAHFHLTEIGRIQRDFIDCGGRRSSETMISLQLWNDQDVDHRLGSGKLLKIIEQSEKVLDLENLPVEVEYQGETIGRYDLEHDGQDFQLVPKQTDCRAKEICGIDIKKPLVRARETAETSCCGPSSSCC